ncbi:MAG: hypothetical protein IJJ33_00135, partial [Victivallales bacterium]|nr:hypothetical protein [Victivallales bacterium]
MKPTNWLMWSLLLCTLMVQAGEEWYFLPCFQKRVSGMEAPSADGVPFHQTLPPQIRKALEVKKGLTEAERGAIRWHRVEFPHWDFVKLMPKNNVYGWYGCEFDVPQNLLGMDLLVDLGVIDDVDETYLNGTSIGATGSIPKRSAWQKDRLYRVAAEKLALRKNYLAVQVWSNWGFGGIAGPAILKAALCPSDAQWELAKIRDKHAPQKGLNQARTLQQALALFSENGSFDWLKLPMPWEQYASWQKDEHFALFRVALELPSTDEAFRFPAPVVLDLGPVYDVAAFYLNGKRLGLTGRFPEGKCPAFTETSQRAQFLVPSECWRADGRNELVSIVYRERGIGGLPNLPGVLLSNPLEH